MERNPADIERTASVTVEDVPSRLNDFTRAGATHLILGIGMPWDFGPVEQLVKWRDSNR